MRWGPGGRMPFVDGKVSEPSIRNTVHLPTVGHDQSKFVKAAGPGMPTVGALASISFRSLSQS